MSILCPDCIEELRAAYPGEDTFDNYDLWHIWVYPTEVQIGFGFHPEQEGGGLRI